MIEDGCRPLSKIRQVVRTELAPRDPPLSAPIGPGVPSRPEEGYGRSAHRADCFVSTPLRTPFFRNTMLGVRRLLDHNVLTVENKEATLTERLFAALFVEAVHEEDSI